MGEITINARIEKIKEKKVTKLQRKLIQFMEANSYENIIYFSITEFAAAAGVAEATVLRFCRSLGFNGYQDFKLSLAPVSYTHLRDVFVAFTVLAKFFARE